MNQWTRSLATIGMLFLGAVDNTVTAQTEPTPAAPLEAGAPAFPNEFENVLVLYDPLPVLRQILDSDKLRIELTEGKLSRALGDKKPAWMEPGILKERLEASAQAIPTQAILVMGSDGYEMLTRGIRVGLLLDLCKSALLTKTTEPDFHQKLLLEIKALQMPRLALWLRTREPETAGRWFKAMRDAAPALFMVGGSESSTDRRIDVKFSVGKLMDAPSLQIALAESGIVASAEDPKSKELAEAITAWTAEASVELRADGLLFALGPAWPSPTPANQAIEALATGGPGQIFASRWNFAPLKQGFLEARELWLRAAQTAAGAAALEMDKEDDLIGTILIGARNVETIALTGNLLATAEGRALDISVHLQGARPAEDLRSSDLPDWVPASAEAFTLDSTLSLAETIAGGFSNFEDRLEQQLLKAELQPDGEKKAELLRKVKEFYYQRLNGLRGLIFNRAFEVFEPGMLIVLRANGAFSDLLIQIGDAPKPAKINLRDLPVVEIAMVGRIRKEIAPLDFAKSLNEALVEGFRATFSLPPLPLAETQFQFAPGISARRFSLGVLPEALANTAWFNSARAPIGPVSGKSYDLLLPRELSPHAFALGGFLAFSSSERLSLDMLAARVAKAGHPEFPPAEAGKLVGYGRISGKSIAQILRGIGPWLNLLALDGNHVQFEGLAIRIFDGINLASLQQTQELLEGVANLIEAGEMSWTGIDDATGRVYHEKIQF